MRLPFSVQSNLMMRELLSALSAIFAFISFCPPPSPLTLAGQSVEQKKGEGHAERTFITFDTSH